MCITILFLRHYFRYCLVQKSSMLSLVQKSRMIIEKLLQIGNYEISIVHPYIPDIIFRETFYFQLDYQGVTVQNVSINVQGGQPNVLQTFWQQSDVDLSRGMDFTPRGAVFARFTHLQHAPFVYNIVVNNQGPQRRGTCRIFLAPKFDERGLPWLFRDQKGLMIEMDHFTVTCK